ncbi:hypothetical protein [Gracilibacillus saliphilus]|uniref:hypothetical protein n=1 Tax=Gracilibacillus saliphilus TaxID=543890 RepID=UPI0013D7FC7F|nr:hypothetical protein [Gracilibacillus saliphilus]
MNNSNYVDYEDIKASSEHKSEYIRELQQQNKQLAEEKQELEERFEILSEQHDLALQQNKRYEELLRKIRDYEATDWDEDRYLIDYAINQALQNK